MTVAVVLSIVAGTEASAASGGNPLLTGERAQQSDQSASGAATLGLGARAAEAQGGVFRTVGRWLVWFQSESNRRIAKHMKAIRDGDSMWMLLVGAGLAFVYGVLHALGPGHGKLVVVSYFLAENARPIHGIRMGFEIAFFHVISAIVVVALADLIFRQLMGYALQDSRAVRLVSYGTIAGIGMFMLFRAAKGGEHHHHSHHRDQGLLSFAVGLVPCTGAVLIMLYALANGIVLAGAILVACIGLGMAMTMSTLGLISVVAREVVAQRLGAHGAASSSVGRIAAYAGGAAVTALGGGLFALAL